VLFRPDDLAADSESAAFEAACYLGGMNAGVPNVSHVSRKQLICFDPIYLIVVLNRSGLSDCSKPGPFAPHRIVFGTVGLISNHQHRSSGREKPRNIFCRGSVAAEYTMLPTQPEVSKPRNRLCGWFRRNVIRGVVLIAEQELINLGFIESGKVQIEINPFQFF
jgi:hypothetical protein